jgi:hypothetical protein
MFYKNISYPCLFCHIGVAKEPKSQTVFRRSWRRFYEYGAQIFSKCPVGLLGVTSLKIDFF